MTPKVSVIVPVYNCEDFLTKCICSLVNQTYKNLEIILVDDGSTDKSEEIIKQFIKKDTRLSYYSQINSGPSEARNNGISRATGEYLIFVDADDTVDNNYIESLVNKILESGSDLVCCGYREISNNGIISCLDFDFDSLQKRQKFMEMVCQGTGGVLWGKIYKKEIITKNNLYMDKNIFMSEDLIFVLQYSALCESFTVLREYLYSYNRLNPNSISSNVSMMYIQNEILVCKHIDEVLRSVNIDEIKINEIITKRIQNLVTSLIDRQTISLKETGIKKVINNVKQLLTGEYICQYKDKFSSKNYYYKPYMFFIKNDFILGSIIYSICLNKLRNLRKCTNK